MVSVFLGVIGFFVFCLAVFSTVYFSGRTKSVQMMSIRNWQTKR